mgnify:CR=1 FL=1
MCSSVLRSVRWPCPSTSTSLLPGDVCSGTGTGTGDGVDSDNEKLNELSSKKTSFLNLVYKHVIGMIGQTIPKQPIQFTTSIASTEEQLKEKEEALVSKEEELKEIKKKNQAMARKEKELVEEVADLLKKLSKSEEKNQALQEIEKLMKKDTTGKSYQKRVEPWVREFTGSRFFISIIRLLRKNTGQVSFLST